MSGPLQYTQNGWVPAISTSSAPANVVEDEDEFELAVAQPRPTPSPPPSAKPRTSPAKAINVIALAKERLREINQEIRRLKALEKERDELQRLIAAAKPTPPSRRTKG